MFIRPPSSLWQNKILVFETFCVTYFHCKQELEGGFETGRCAEGTVGWTRGLGRQIWALSPTRPLLLGKSVK